MFSTMNLEKINTKAKVAVCSRSFSRNAELRNILISKFSKVKFNDQGLKLDGNSLIEYLQGYTHAITALEKIDRSLIESLPSLKVISKYGVGLDMIDIESLVKHKIRLGWTTGVNKRSVAELTLLFMLIMIRKVNISNRELINGTWRQVVGGELTNRTVGIIGCGNIGKDLVTLLTPFKCNILVYDIINYEEFYSKFNIKAVSKEELLSKSDLITIHVPLNQSTKNLIDYKEFSILNRNSILINAARGGIVNQKALKKALINNKIAGAAFDVFEEEPPTDIELINHPNFYGTQHIGGSSKEAIYNMGLAAIEGLTENRIPVDLSTAFKHK